MRYYSKGIGGVLTLVRGLPYSLPQITVLSVAGNFDPIPIPRVWWVTPPLAGLKVRVLEKVGDVSPIGGRCWWLLP